jgi:hypothetical protein
MQKEYRIKRKDLRYSVKLPGVFLPMLKER